ncbi:alpha/beta hydrolase [Thalassobacillus sp. CUG 92003]|uniref:alpha/beta hydrolase n=1 Tax=Thalassobacillus sp. CUG 92003 TaxID=2736641 RepID=UPI001C62FF97|nr:alpha/beta hydrolase [Thalassobacillus sp. CUG 92003]
METNGQQSKELEEYQTRDGSSLTYRYYDSTAENILILIHGSGYHSEYLEPLATNLSQEGVASVYTPNLRGHGPNPEKRGDVDYLGQIEQDLNDLIDYIRKRHPEQPIILGGHSSGGGTVIRFAGGEFSHNAVNRYLLIAPYIHHNAPTNKSNNEWANVNTPRIIGLSMLNQIGITHLNDRNVISFNMPNNYRDNTETLRYSYRLQTSMHPRPDYEKDISSMDGEVLVLAGSGDKSFKADQYEKVFNTHPNTEVMIMEGLSHFAPINDNDAQNEIATWLEN